MNKIYCDNRFCPFDDCDKHLPREKGTYTVMDISGMCVRYISWLVSEVKKDGSA